MKPTTMKSLRSTMAVFTRALSWMPSTRSTVSSATISPAGRLRTMGMPRRCGAAASRPGVWRAWSSVVDSQSGRCEPEPGQERLEVVRPAHRHRDVAHGVLEDEVPADDPGHELAERDVGVGVGAAGHRHHRGHLGVAERREAAGDGHQDVREDERRAGSHVRAAAGRGRSGRAEDAGADDRADAQRGEREHSQGALQPVFGAVGVGLAGLDGLPAEQGPGHEDPAS